MVGVSGRSVGLHWHIVQDSSVNTVYIGRLLGAIVVLWVLHQIVGIQHVFCGITDLVESRPVCLAHVLTRSSKAIEVEALLRGSSQIVVLEPHIVAGAETCFSLTRWRNLAELFVGMKLWNMKIAAITT